MNFNNNGGEMTLEELEAAIPKFAVWEGERVYLTLDIDPFERCWVAEYKNEDYETRGLGKLSALGETITSALQALYTKLQEKDPQPIDAPIGES
jgi:hypothetical protein